MKILIAEDDLISQRLLQVILASYGTCSIAVNGREAVDSFKCAWTEGCPYDLICLDIMMPEMDGQEALKEIRRFERERGIANLEGVKVIMTTALGDAENIKKAFDEHCHAYLLKPVAKQRLIDTMQRIGLLGEN